MGLNITYKRDMNHTYTLFSGGKIQSENYEVQVALHRLLKGLLPCSLHALDGSQIWYCENTSLQKLSSYCQMHPLGKEELVWIFGGLLENFLEMQEYLMRPDFLYLTPEELYLDIYACRVRCCFVPFYQRDIWSSLLEISQYLLGYLNQQDGEAVTLAYGIFRYLSQGGTNLEDLWNLLYGNKKEKNLKKQKNNDTNKYVKQIRSEKEPTESGKAESRESEDRKPEGRKPEGRKLEVKKAEDGKAEERKTGKSYESIQPNKIRKISEAMEEQRKRDLDAFFKEEEEWPKQEKHWLSRLHWPPRWNWKKRAKRKEKTEKTFLNELELDLISEQLNMDIYHKEENNEQYCAADQKKPVMEMGTEEREAATTLLSAICPQSQAMLIHEESHTKFPLVQPMTIIGKMPGTAQIILKEATVSRIHARIVCREDEYYLEDLNSRNGTYVNECLLENRESFKLKSGDRIKFADVECTYVRM